MLRTSALCTPSPLLSLEPRVSAWKRLWRDMRTGSRRNFSLDVSHLRAHSSCFRPLTKYYFLVHRLRWLWLRRVVRRRQPRLLRLVQRDQPNLHGRDRQQPHRPPMDMDALQRPVSGSPCPVYQLSANLATQASPTGKTAPPRARRLSCPAL